MTTLLRKLTLKSKLGFGKYGHLPIEKILGVYTYRGVWYLRRVYFTKSRISFNSEVLSCLGISEEDRLIKPGALSFVPKKYKGRVMVKTTQPKMRPLILAQTRSNCPSKSKLKGINQENK